MKPTQTKTRIAVSDDGDVLIDQGPAQPVFFISRTQAAAFVQAPTTTTVVLITNVGAAAIKTMLAADAKFDAQEIDIPDGMKSIILRFRLSNGLVVAYITDEVLAGDRERLDELAVDIAVTDGGIDWRRQHAPFIGDVIAHIPPASPQMTQLENFDANNLAQLVRDALTHRESSHQSENK